MRQYPRLLRPSRGFIDLPQPVFTIDGVPCYAAADLPAGTVLVVSSEMTLEEVQARIQSALPFFKDN